MIIIGLLVLLAIVIIAMGGWDKFKAKFHKNTDEKPGVSPDGLTMGPSPEEILRERYARGELNRKEYLEAKETLSK